MTTTDTYEGWIGRTAVDRDGDKVGTIADIYYDDATDQPEWITVRTGLLGTRSSFVPLRGAENDGEHLRLPFQKAQIKNAPNIDDDGSLTPDEERTLYEHYGRGTDLDTAHGDGTGTDDADPTRTDDAVTGSEQDPQPGRARLRKFVVSGQKTVTVQVQPEEVHIEVVEDADERP